MGEDGNRMIDREALAAALLVYENEIMVDPVVVTALKERLAQLPEKCGTCKGTGSTFDDPNCYACTCPICHGKGFLYPPAFVERIARAIYTAAFADRDLWESIREEYRDFHRSTAVAVLDALNTETL